MVKYLMRFDDINSRQDWERFFNIKNLLEKYNIKSILGVVPNCLDEDLYSGKSFDGYYDYLIKWFNKAVDEGFISSENLKELLISNCPDELVEMVVNHQKPSDDNWTKRLGL